MKGLSRVRSELKNNIAVEKLSLMALLFGTLLLYIYGISQNGYANSYYTAAVQAASTSWKAFFFGSLDAASWVTVDKPPVAIWFMALSARIFGFSSFSMLLPNALAGVASVWLLYASVKRLFDAKSALIAGAVMALTPVAALMFCFNNPEGILTLFMTASGYAFIRALDEEKPLLWLGLAGLFTGFAFNTKMLQGLILLPVMFCVYSCFAKPKLLVRIWHMLFAGIITTASTLWWSIIVWMTPAASRPYIGSSSQNNIWDLIMGYNGLGRLLGNRMGGGPGGGGPMDRGSFYGSGVMGSSLADGGMGFAGGGPGGPSPGMMGGPMGGGMGPGPGGGGGMGPGGNGFGGQTGLFRIFNSDFGPNIGWLIPFSIVSAVLIAWLLRRMPRDNKQRAAVLFWGGWVILHVAVFSITSGVIHPYYPIVMAPAVGALVGVGIPYLWETYKSSINLLWVLPLTVLTTAIISSTILSYNNNWPWLTWGMLAGGVLAGILLLLNQLYSMDALRKTGLVLAALACAVGPLVFTISTVSTAHNGSIPTSGPGATAVSRTNNESALAESSLVNYLTKNRNGAKWLVAVSSANESAPIQISSRQPVMAIGGFNGGDNTVSLDDFKALIKEGKIRYYAVSSRGPDGFGGGPGGGRRPGGNSEIESWIKTNCTEVNYGGDSVTLYKLKL
jgi:4-amino-4-deoxy-L-arabinose transferase-like glycosyltransferase